MKLCEKVMFSSIKRFLKEFDRQKGSKYLPMYLDLYAKNDVDGMKLLLDEVKGQLNV